MFAVGQHLDEASSVGIDRAGETQQDNARFRWIVAEENQLPEISVIRDQNALREICQRQNTRVVGARSLAGNQGHVVPFSSKGVNRSRVDVLVREEAHDSLGADTVGVFRLEHLAREVQTGQDIFTLDVRVAVK